MRYYEFKLTEAFDNSVLELQTALKAVGANLGPFGPKKDGLDGLMGPYTRRAAKEYPEIAVKFSSALSKPDSPNSAGMSEKDSADMANLDSVKGADDAKKSADKYLGRAMSDKEWNYLLRATYAEASPNNKEQGYVMGVILNRARSSGNVITTLTARNQFQAVTGTRYDPGPSPNFSRGPSGDSLKSILYAAINVLPSVDTNLTKFTAASSAAYGPGTNIGYRSQLIAQGGQKIGGTIFAA